MEERWEPRQGYNKPSRYMSCEPGKIGDLSNFTTKFNNVIFSMAADQAVEDLFIRKDDEVTNVPLIPVPAQIVQPPVIINKGKMRTLIVTPRQPA